MLMIEIISISIKHIDGYIKHVLVFAKFYTNTVMTHKCFIAMCVIRMVGCRLYKAWKDEGPELPPSGSIFSTVPLGPPAPRPSTARPPVSGRGAAAAPPQQAEAALPVSTGAQWGLQKSQFR